MAGELDTYHRKRNFRQTPEPRGKKGSHGGQSQFVIQKHDARRLHYDFRLEHGGVLKSWAVPKEPSLDPKVRRLAVRTEDHPLDYGSFEGEIPEHQYGAGSVVIWDRGSWLPLSDPTRGLEDGKLDFELHGDRLNGRWTLVRMADRGKRKDAENWLLIKRSDKRATTPAPTAARTRTATRASAATPTRAPKRARTTTSARAKTAARATGSMVDALRAIAGAKRAALASDVAPQLATLVAQPPTGEGWIHEPKLDGYRLLCRIDRGRVRLLTRRGNDWSDRFPGIADAARKLPARSALLDGEAVLFDERGLTDFQRLQNAIADVDRSIVLVAFDLLHLDGYDLRGAPLLERKQQLRTLLAAEPTAIRYGEHVEQSGAAFFREACGLGLEGIVAKRAGDPYRSGRTKSWLKVKCLLRQEFVIVGYTDPAGARTGLGALLLGTRAEAGAPLRYVGKVGTGFDEQSLRTLSARLATIVRRQSPVEAASARGIGRNVHWVEPELIAEISFGEWTADKRLRHPVFHGVRADKVATEVVEERPAAAAVEPTARRVRLSSPDKIVFPDPGITKRQLASYWEQMAVHALPLIAQRPLTLFRCPDGYEGQCFYQKHAGAAVPAVVPRIQIDDGEPYTMIDGLDSLLGLVQIGALELHVWGARAPQIEQPDTIVFDLDPSEELRWPTVAGAAVGLKERLGNLGLGAFARLTGGKGLHVVVPVIAGPEWPAIKKFARAVVDEMVRDEPRRFTASMSKMQRTGKIFVDYLRNERGATAIASYSPRARAGAPVALPIAWDELDAKAQRPPRYGLLEVPAFVRRRGADPWAAFESARRSLLDD